MHLEILKIDYKINFLIKTLEIKIVILQLLVLKQSGLISQLNQITVSRTPSCCFKNPQKTIWNRKQNSLSPLGQIVGNRNFLSQIFFFILFLAKL
ncbi:hypothetical protein TTHERM_000090289 (macronuclear) [Tetrahymena thermophila SB210]|uniref:Uncharacterized protein n=1 Tax=Tetrahymena thermophila (strain SB210) TaxID=312017 RepID=W7XCL6_TETTS|nr:hypothetical protein TTHERM_000090289 [Tetrahymena thermophila SB210]EWS75207.1 hypothetical protein TTHERM_000090289 [Tetrahymena thermophila SB210]|eukprot:XP_012652198.1 hypothetical protein TTHERM_000090289 [Tetrahymena thermophila SB210]